MAISEVYNMDCMDYMKTIPDMFFDLAVCDPPYGINIGKRKTIGKRKKSNTYTVYKISDYDNKIPDVNYFEELTRISKNQIIFGANYFAKLLPSNGAGWIVWDKNLPEDISFAHGELIYTSFDRALRIYRGKRGDSGNNISNNPAKAKLKAKINQCQKPKDLYKYLYNFAKLKPGAKIFDSHLGSGNSRIVAKLMGFDFYGTEIDKRYFDDSIIAYEREINGIIQTKGITVVQTRLF